MADGKYYSLFKSLPTALTPKEDAEPGIYENTYKIFNALKDDGFELDYYQSFMKTAKEEKGVNLANYREVIDLLERAEAQVVGNYIMSVLREYFRGEGYYVLPCERVRDSIGICLKILDKKIEEKQYEHGE